MVETIAEIIRAYMHIIHKKLPVLNPGIAIFQVNPSQANRFYLRALKGNTGLHGFLDKIQVPGFAVLGQNFGSGLACSSCYLFIPFPDN
jgi:hypothetical protein